MKTKLLYLLVISFVSLQLFSQELLPFVENYNKSNYQGDNQIWSAVQGNDKAMYFANNNYLLRFDGVKWEKYTLPNKTIIRSVMVDGDRIYTGSYQEFGYWYRNKASMHYVSLTKGKRYFDDTDNEEIWKILKHNGKIYFQSFNGVFVLEHNVVTEKKFPFLISYCFVVNNQLLIASVKNGIYQLENNTINKVEGLSLLENKVVHSIQEYHGKKYYFTQKNGVFVFENNSLKVWNHKLNEQFKTSIINVAQFIRGNKLVVGTANKGVYILDLNDDSFKNINRNNVLMNNSVLCIYQDKENDLWLGLDNGISHVEVNSSLSIFYDSSGTLGSVYSVASISNGYLLASNHGIFKYQDKLLSLIPNTQGQTWNISKINNQYLIGHNEGTYIYNEGNLHKLSDINGGWNLTKSIIGDLYLQATYNGIVVYNNANDLAKSIIIKGLQKPIKYLAQNRKNEIWAADNNKGLYRILYNDKYETVKIDNVTKRCKIANDFGVKIFEFRNEILFLINNSWYTYNSISNKLEKNELFDKNFKNISDVVAIDENHFVVLQEGLLYHINLVGTKFVKNRIPEKYYKGKIINGNLKIFKDANGYLLNLDDGFITLQLDNVSKSKPDVKIEAFSDNNLIENNSTINLNSELLINVISGIYGNKKPELFYKVNGANEFMPVKSGLILLNNLNSGSYEVVIYNNDGLKYNPIANFDFEVAKAWYFSNWMLLFYLILIAIVLYVYYRWNKMKYLQKLKLQKEELKHQKEILEMELKAENELNVQEYEKHILQLELQSKSLEIASKSLSIAKQSEMIEKIQNILDSESDFNKLKSEIKKSIRINEVNKHEWEVFESNLSLINNEFIIALSKKFPSLTSKDIKLCIYLKMNLSSKEIAPMMNISFRGVELHRYRLRKKLGLSQEESLSMFLLSV